ncbi:MAG: ABC transporter permease, partial [Clostridia bacterium]
MIQVTAIIGLLFQAVRYGTPLLFATTGEILTEKSGSLNLGVEGTMAVGAIGGFLFACYADSLIIGIIGAFLCAGLCGLLFSFLTVKLQANQNVTGLAMTIFGVGLYQFIGQTMKTKGTFPMMSERLCAIIADKPATALGDIPYVGELFFSYNPLVYVAIAVAILVWIYVRFTRTGLKV